MSKLVWDKIGERFYETGISQCALFVQQNGTYPKGVAWNGVSSITESPSGAEANPIYADNIKYLNLMSVEDFGGTIEAYTYPEEFGQCDGSVAIGKGVYIAQQARKAFGLVYKTQIGNDEDGDQKGYKLHLVYGATATPSSRDYTTINDSPEANAFSWEFSTVPVEVTGHKPTSLITIDSTKVDPEKLAAFEKIIYGDEGVEPSLPLPDAVAAQFANT